jgi:hypothetical protein
MDLVVVYSLTYVLQIRKQTVSQHFARCDSASFSRCVLMMLIALQVANVRYGELVIRSVMSS